MIIYSMGDWTDGQRELARCLSPFMITAKTHVSDSGVPQISKSSEQWGTQPTVQGA